MRPRSWLNRVSLDRRRRKKRWLVSSCSPHATKTKGCHGEGVGPKEVEEDPARSAGVRVGHGVVPKHADVLEEPAEGRRESGAGEESYRRGRAACLDCGRWL